MQTYVVTATKGRAKETLRLLDCLQVQTLQPNLTIIVGTEARDLEGIQDHPLIKAGHGEAFVSPKIGTTSQRNFGLEILEKRGCFAPDLSRFFCVFFDDDYRPDKDWLKRADERFTKGDIVGLSGKVLADGVCTGGLTEDQAEVILNGEMPPQSRRASDMAEHITDCAYGCNMAFIDTVIRQTRFDEVLPLYGWQEDRDYSGMARRFGPIIYFPDCRGVHLGVRSGRTSGLRFGYSQIANPFYLMKKGTMGYKAGYQHMARNITANIVRSLINTHPHVDYLGRLRGNIRAVLDVVCMRSDPTRIVDDNF